MNRDARRRQKVCAYEVQRTLYKSLAYNMALPTAVRHEMFQKLAHLPRNSSVIRVVNRCIQSHRPKAVYKRFKLSRIAFRECASRGMLPGVYKASW